MIVSASADPGWDAVDDPLALGGAKSIQPDVWPGSSDSRLSCTDAILSRL
jgi:hypothetical protein